MILCGKCKALEKIVKKFQNKLVKLLKSRYNEIYENRKVEIEFTMFSVGDLVVHPMHGAGVIDAIVQEKVAGSTQDYYVFKMPVGGLLLKIPTANSQTIGVRSVIQRPEAEALIAAIPSLAVEESSNWNKRYRENLLRMKSGDLYEVARVIKGLMFRERKRGLSNGERKMLHTARQILLSELVLAEDSGYEEVERRVEQAMLQTPEIQR